MNLSSPSGRVTGVILSCILAAVAWTSAAGASPGSLVYDWAGEPERRWPGADWYANRVQDWAVRADALECWPRLPLRTAHLLPARLEVAGLPIGAEVTMRLRLEPVGGTPARGAFAGLLIGAGSRTIDHRLTAMVQQAPGVDGGTLVVADEREQVRVFDFGSVSGQATFRWSLPRDVTTLDLAEIVPAEALRSRQDAWAPEQTRTLEVVCRAEAGGAASLTARLMGGGRVISSVQVNGLAEHVLDGGIALVGHRDTGAAGWRFRSLEIESDDGWVNERPARRWGPVLGVLYTVDRDDAGASTLRLTAQFPVMPIEQVQDVVLELSGADGRWQEVANATVEPDSFTARFVAPGVSEGAAGWYRVRGTIAGREGARTPFEFGGELRPPPPDGQQMTLAMLSCVKHYTGGQEWNHDGLWFPHADLVESVLEHDPDILYFAGDQIYEGDLSPPDRRRIVDDYHTRWQRFLWAFGPLTRDRPTIAVPDDHDVYHGNLWGAGGISARARDGMTAQDAGGYRSPAAVVNAIHRTQTGHHPPSVIEGPIGEGVRPFTSRLRWGGLDAAILSDRMWKDSATVVVPEGQVVNGWFTAPGFDPRRADVAEARLLGPEQEAFLERWAADPDPRSPFRVVLSQTPFVNVATLPSGTTGAVIPSLELLAPGERPPDDRPVADCDSGGWPQSARSRAVRQIAAAGALHLAGDQHLATLVQYGLDGHRDGPFVFTGPAVANTWPRRWMPTAGGADRSPDAPFYTGDFEDGFGNRMTVWAVANPRAQDRLPTRLHDLSPGYGIVRFADVDGPWAVVEAWPRWASPSIGDEPYEGWPLRIPLRPTTPATTGP